MKKKNRNLLNLGFVFTKNPQYMSKSYFQVAKMKNITLVFPFLCEKSKKIQLIIQNFHLKKFACHTEMENENEIITHIFEKKKKVDP